MLITLAWRNLWRQKRRTLFTATALALALILSLFMRCLQEGSYANHIDNAARFYTGMIQLQHPDYVESQSIDDLLPASDSFIAAAKQHPLINHTLPRIESFALAAAGERSKGVVVMGVSPEQENNYSAIADKLVAGEFLTSSDNQVLISEGLAHYLQLNTGDEIVLYGQGYRGQTAAGLYRVKGILHFPVPQLDNQLVYMPLPLAQTLYSTGNQVSAWVLHSNALPQLATTVKQLSQDYTDKAKVRDWEALSPELAQQIVMDRVSGIFLMYLLYGVVGFGLFATLLMMTLERQREFGVMLATGLLRRKLLTLISIESLFIALLGISMGMLIVTPLLGWFYFHPIQLTGETAEMMLEMGFEPILPLSLAPSLFFNQIAIVLVLLALCLLYPIWRSYRLNLVGALKGGVYAD